MQHDQSNPSRKSQAPETTEILILPDRGSWISGSAEPVPYPKCSRCEDWTTILHSSTMISPCPVCRPDEYEAWLAVDGHAIAAREPVA